jgi:chromosome partitioning protein
MKVIATINFKGGVGKTTITWLLACHVAQRGIAKVLLCDSDAQMSLTTALMIDEEKGTYYPQFQKWYEERHVKKNKTLLDALDAYDQHARSGGHFNFSIDSDFIYEVGHNLHFIPSSTDLYWLELDVYKPENIKGFIRAILGKIEHSRHRRYDIVFFDCPPSFTLLSYSVLSNCSLILIPINPDAFAAKGLEIMVDGLKSRIQPWPEPQIAVFMNKARLWRNDLTRDTQKFFNDVKKVADDFTKKGIEVHVLDSYIPERAGIRKAISLGGFPEEFRKDVEALWIEIQRLL